jgi:ribosomal protein S18 acetylase RimI-like enzyme
MASPTGNFMVQRDVPLTGSAVEALRIQVGWDGMPGYYQKILDHSYAHFSIHQVGQLIGFVNVISDGIADAFLVDLMVHPDYQRLGLGRSLVDHAIQGLKADGIRCIEVIFDPALEEFYQRCGFHILSAGIIDTWLEGRGFQKANREKPP